MRLPQAQNRYENRLRLTQFCCFRKYNTRKIVPRFQCDDWLIFDFTAYDLTRSRKEYEECLLTGYKLVANVNPVRRRSEPNLAVTSSDGMSTLPDGGKVPAIWENLAFRRTCHIEDFRLVKKCSEN